MASHEQIRYRLYRRLTELVGEQEAAQLMPPFTWNQVVTKPDLAELRVEIADRFADVYRELGAIRQEIGSIRQEIGTAIRGQTLTLVMAMFVTVAAVAVLVLAFA